MRLEELERELLAERPEIDPDFASRVDEWAARGFPRGGELDPRRKRHAVTLPNRLRRGWERLRGPRPRRLLAPAGAAATLIVVVAVAATQIESVDRDGGAALTAPAEVETAEDEAFRETGQPRGGPDAAGGTRAVEEAELSAPPAGGSDGPAGGRRDEALSDRPRRIAQMVALSLATAPEDFRDSADAVVGVARDHNGFVARSSVSGGDPSVDGAELGRAIFRLRIPATQLQAALGALSDLGHLVSRTDGTRDITARFSSARERIETFTEARDRVLRQLEEAVTETEQESIRRRLRIVESRLENARDDLARAQQRVRLVPVSVTLTADESIRDGSGWGIGDALEDAERVLTVAAGVILVSAAVLLPLAILVAIGGLIASRARRLRRDRALDA